MNNIAKMESEHGTWDYVHHSTSSQVELIRYRIDDELIEPVSTWMDYSEWNELVDMIKKLEQI